MWREDSNVKTLKKNGNTGERESRYLYDYSPLGLWIFMLNSYRKVIFVAPSQCDLSPDLKDSSARSNVHVALLAKKTGGGRSSGHLPLSRLVLYTCIGIHRLSQSEFIRDGQLLLSACEQEIRSLTHAVNTPHFAKL